MGKIKLVDAIAQLRRELYKANKAGEQEELKLEIEAIDVEFEVELAKQGEVGAEFGFNVVVADAKLHAGGDIASKQSHRVRLHLKPTMNGRSAQIEDKTEPADD